MVQHPVTWWTKSFHGKMTLHASSEKPVNVKHCWHVCTTRLHFLTQLTRARETPFARPYDAPAVLPKINHKIPNYLYIPRPSDNHEKIGDESTTMHPTLGLHFCLLWGYLRSFTMHNLHEKNWNPPLVHVFLSAPKVNGSFILQFKTENTRKPRAIWKYHICPLKISKIPRLWGFNFQPKR